MEMSRKAAEELTIQMWGKGEPLKSESDVLSALAWMSEDELDDLETQLEDNEAEEALEWLRDRT